MNSPTNPASPGSPAPANAPTSRIHAKRGIGAASPPKPSMRRWCARS
jgi:hypothetical protein